VDNAERIRKRRRLLRLNPTNYTAIARMGEYAKRRGESDNERQEQGTGTKAQGYGQSTTVAKPIPVEKKNILPVEQKKVVKKQQGVDDTELINRLNKEKAEESKQKTEPVRQQGNKKQRLRRRADRKPLTAEEKARRDARNKKVLSTVGTVAGAVVGATFVGKLGKVAQVFAKTPAGKALMKKGKSAFKKGLARFTKAYKKRFPQADLAKKQPRDARGRPKATTTEKTTTKQTTTKKTQPKKSTDKQKILDELAKERGKRKVLGKKLRKSRLESGAVKKRLGKAVRMFKRGELVVRRKVGETVEKVGKKIQPTKLKTGARSQPPQKSNRRVKREQAQKKLNKFVDSKNPKTEKDKTYDKAVKGQVDAKQLRTAITEKFRSLIGSKGKINLTNADRAKANKLREEILKQTENKIISNSASQGLVRVYGQQLKKILDKYDKKN
tara:strand:+ start:1498 stop:2820 length:1323 start_codon:yes stop_codon:yes gene_type:complete